MWWGTTPYSVHLGGVWNFVDWTEQVKLPKARYDFRSPNPKFWRPRVIVFIFKKFQGAQILLFFCENWHEASFYNNEQTQNTNLIFEFKNYFICTPRKKLFLHVLALIQL